MYYYITFQGKELISCTTLLLILLCILYNKHVPSTCLYHSCLNRYTDVHADTQQDIYKGTCKCEVEFESIIIRRLMCVIIHKLLPKNNTNNYIYTCYITGGLYSRLVSMPIRGVNVYYPPAVLPQTQA